MKQILKSLYQNSRNKEVKKLIFNTFNEDYIIRISVVRIPSTPVSSLEKLSNDEDYFVRSSVAENPRTPVYVLEKLSKDKESIVRLCVIKNLNDKKSINKISFLDYLKDLFYNLFKKKKKRE